METLSHHYQTSSLEAFRGVILCFAPGLWFSLSLQCCAGTRLYSLFCSIFKGICALVATWFAFDLIHLSQVVPCGCALQWKCRPWTGNISGTSSVPLPRFLSSQFEKPSKEGVIVRPRQGVVENQQTVHPDQETPDIASAQHRTGGLRSPSWSIFDRWHNGAVCNKKGGLYYHCR